MTRQVSESAYDVIVIGSGMGGMATATALSRMDRKVLLLEQAAEIGGLTHSFSRDGFTWDVGIHYCGTFGPDQSCNKMLDWLSGDAIEFRSVGTVYDTLHFPDGFDISVGRPEETYKTELKERFPDSAAEIDAWFEALASGEETLFTVCGERSMPEPFSVAHRWWNKEKIQRWVGRTTSEVLEDCVSDPKLAAVLAAQWGTYGGLPDKASFGVHATIMRHYLAGAGYPVGGASAIAAGLVPVIEAAGGKAQAGTPVTEIVLEDGRATGVRTRDGQAYSALVIVSAIGAGETVSRLLPPEVGQQEWATEISALEPSVCHFEVYLGFEGDIEKYGATRSNHWFFANWDPHRDVWSDPESPFESVFVSFPSLKDPEHEPGPANRHTGQFMVLADWSTVAEFAAAGKDRDTAAWSAFKASILDKMMDFFNEKFPALAPLVVHKELGTPLATAAYTGHEKGGFYGLEATPRRLLSDALGPKTPVPGLYLTGQDVVTPGIAGSLWAGMLTAAAIEPRVYMKVSKVA